VENLRIVDELWWTILVTEWRQVMREDLPFKILVLNHGDDETPRVYNKLSKRVVLKPDNLKNPALKPLVNCRVINLTRFPAVCGISFFK
jgi:hypothetical protein